MKHLIALSFPLLFIAAASSANACKDVSLERPIAVRTIYGDHLQLPVNTRTALCNQDGIDDPIFDGSN